MGLVHSSGQEAASIPSEPVVGGRASAPACRSCGSPERVACYPADQPRQAICTGCCATAEHPDGETGHQFSYAPYEGHTCDYCGINRNDTDWRYHGDDE